MSTELTTVDAAPAPHPAQIALPPAEVMQRARAQAAEIVRVADEAKLFANIQGRKYPLVECLELIGQMTGNTARIAWSRKVDPDMGVGDGWEAKAEVLDTNGTVVGAAEAMCLRSERAWSNRDEYALRSMAQTRATAKALRMRVGFIVSLAGAEPTPAEEMPSDAGRRAQTTKPRVNPVADQRWEELQQTAEAPPADVAKVLKEAGVTSREALTDDATFTKARELIEAAFGPVTVEGEIIND